jgi:polyisoprenoid-binding protein YceI
MMVAAGEGVLTFRANLHKGGRKMKNTLRNLFCAVICSASAANLSTEGATRGGDIQFMASQEGVSLQGSFKDFAANVKFDPMHPETGAVRVSVDIRSVNTGTPAANELIKSSDFFDVATFPQATFEASEFHAQDAGHYIAKGSFSLKGRTVTLPVTFATTAAPQGRWLDGSFTISRTLFKVGQGEWSDTSMLDDAVKVQFHILQEGASH